MSALILIALCRLTPKADWSNARREGCTITKGLMDFLKETCRRCGRSRTARYSDQRSRQAA
ncbi:MAG: hypothetical protein OXU77_15425 [Gammaproteobacteria bacterium]|nr:hypothetical protein [Gammaproteobacteria bacterium]MDE0442309.1 hypothetical protein [Gammaproteobacteria bacterium]